MDPELAARGSDAPEANAEAETDRRIVALFWDRDERAVAVYAARCGPYLMTVARSFLPAEEDAEECVSSAYDRAWNQIPPKRPDFLRLFLKILPD